MDPLPDDAFAALYQHLRALARARMSGAPHTLQPTAVVHEALIRLSGMPPEAFRDENHYIATAAQVMRQILIDHARRKLAAKRSGTPAVTPVEQLPAEVVVNPDLAVDLSNAMDKLDSEDPQLGTIVKLRVFAGMTTEEIGALLGVTRKTIERRWRYAAAILRAQLQDWSEVVSDPEQ